MSPRTVLPNRIISTPTVTIHTLPTVEDNHTVIVKEAEIDSDIDFMSVGLATPSRKPKPWHISKKCGIISDWLAYARLTQFRKLSQ